MAGRGKGNVVLKWQMGEFSEIFVSPRSLPPSGSVSIEGSQLRGDSIEGPWGVKVIGFEVRVGEGVMDRIMADRDDSGWHVETIACAAGGRGDPCTRWKKSRKVEDNLSLSRFAGGVIPGGACSPRLSGRGSKVRVLI